MRAIQLRVNGELMQLGGGSSIADLLAQRGLPVAGVAVEVNRTIIPKRLHAVRFLEDGDEVEIVTFVGGG